MLLRISAFMAATLILVLGLGYMLAPSPHIIASVTIDAPPDKVWAIFADTGSYPQWNPEIASLAGPWVVGATLENREGRGRDQMTFYPTVTDVTPGKTLRWSGHLWVPGLFDATHSFTLTARDQGTLFTQTEQFHGLLLWVFDTKPLALVFDTMNQALKHRAEGSINAAQIIAPALPPSPDSAHVP